MSYPTRRMLLVRAPAQSADKVWCMVYDILCHAPQSGTCAYVSLPMLSHDNLIEVRSVLEILRDNLEMYMLLGIDSFIEW